MFGLGKPRFKGPDKKYIRDQQHADDYNESEAIGRVRLGKLCMYYKDLGVKYYCPYEYIERAYAKIEEVQPDDSPAYYYYRLILVHGEKEFANLILNEETQPRQIMEQLQKINPAIEFGYKAPENKKKKSK